MLRFDLEKIHDLRNSILSLSGQDLSRCIQCGKCSAGCPIAPDMDIMPNQIMRFVQLNIRERALTSSMIWVCASCMTCTVRCPEGIDVALVMNQLRKLCIKEGYEPKQKEVLLFNQLFLSSIARFGRLHEFGLIFKYNMMTKNPFKDIGLLPKMLKKGKIGLLAHKIKNMHPVEDAFRKSKAFIKG
jgi:heterodisulfide reductase subunit C